MNNRVFTIANCLLKTLSNGTSIPEDEPVFILRACDTQALSTIRVYQSVFVPTSKHWKIIQAVIEDFTKFREENPDLMGNSTEVY